MGLWIYPVSLETLELPIQRMSLTLLAQHWVLTLGVVDASHETRILVHWTTPCLPFEIHRTFVCSFIHRDGGVIVVWEIWGFALGKQSHSELSALSTPGKSWRIHLVPQLNSLYK